MCSVNKYSILCVDDNKNNLFTLHVLLDELQNIKVYEALSAQEGLDILMKHKIDLILSDIQMPQMNGFEFVKLLKTNKRTKDIPVIFLTAVFKSEEFVHNGFSLGAVDYLTKPIDDKQLLNKIRLYLKLFDEKNRAVAIEKKHKQEKEKTQKQMIHSMVNMIESRDSYTAGHTKRVAQYCEMIAKEMKYSKEDIELLKNAAWLHDIGKISTPDSVLLKPGRLDSLEYKLIQEHLTAGYNLLKEIDEYKKLAEIIHEHHEKYDGTGYPQGLKADEINPLSRIMIVADAFDAMTTNRVYKIKKSVPVALEELQALNGQQFHPEVVKAAIVALKDVVIEGNISQVPKTALEEERFYYFYRDRLTHLFIKDYINLALLEYDFLSHDFFVYEIKLHNFSQYNKKYGWEAGNEFLKEFSQFLSKLSQEDLYFRIEGDDFMILSASQHPELEKQLSQFHKFQNSLVSFEIKEHFVENGSAFHLFLSGT